MNPAPTTECGLPGAAAIPYGLHACHFYLHRDQLIEALVPYFTAGLRRNERCIWVTAPPLPAVEAREALASAWQGTHAAIDGGALRILDFDDWYTHAAGLKGRQVVQLWLEEEERALADGYAGLRITGNTSFLRHSDWPEFMEYEREVSSQFHGRRIVALCSYALGKCTSDQMMAVMRAHPCLFNRREAGWEIWSGRG